VKIRENIKSPLSAKILHLYSQLWETGIFYGTSLLIIALINLRPHHNIDATMKKETSIIIKFGISHITAQPPEFGNLYCWYTKAINHKLIIMGTNTHG
jgi:hypothetical protein